MASGKSIKLSWSDDSDDNNDNEDSGVDVGPLLEKLNLGPKKKLLVISLNGILLSRIHISEETKIPKSRRSDGRYGKILVYKRPFIDQFMKFCLERFEVGLWSSAMEHNVVGAFDCAMGGMRSKLLFEWDQSQCTDTGFKSLEKKTKPLFLKETKEVLAYFDKNPRRGVQFSASDILLLEDKPYRALLNPPNTSIFLESYEAENVTDNALDPKGELGSFLDGLAVADDVPKYVKEHPFGRPAISPDHPDWRYYSKVLRFIDPKGEIGLYLDGLAVADDVQKYLKEQPFGQPAM